METSEAAASHLSPSAAAAAAIISSQRHFYLAVDRIHYKMETLVDLLGMAGRRPWLPMVVCCSTRDELDAVCSAVSNISYICVTPLYSDLAEAERALILDKFRHVTMKWKQNAAVQSGKEEYEKEEQKSHMIVATDACLPLSASGESPISSSVLINYELPTKKFKIPSLFSPIITSKFINTFFCYEVIVTFMSIIFSLVYLH
ncbi:hypothetical protein M8C21_015742 [Ambrosia artemisiifolia]|uniref:Uncharacterized protein n=1 Tax=Ambrosia artemisiifolia TaxID=4212 RepID=A0AAD5CDF1_AMBAR|nr:hypothetical protein M8C21_015742 [Ambrosia artemisiifolia]